MFLFPSRTILFQLQVIIFQKQIFKRFSLEAKERELELIRVKNMKISYKIYCARIHAKNMKIS